MLACVTLSVTIGSERDAWDTTGRAGITRRYLARGAEFRPKIPNFRDGPNWVSRPPPSTTRPSLRGETGQNSRFLANRARLTRQCNRKRHERDTTGRAGASESRLPDDPVNCPQGKRPCARLTRRRVASSVCEVGPARKLVGASPTRTLERVAMRLLVVFAVWPLFLAESRELRVAPHIEATAVSRQASRCHRVAGLTVCHGIAWRN
jgi:hypothetical protein